MRTSARLLLLLQLTLAIGNYLNGGTQKGGAYGFKLSSLSRLADTKSVDGKSSLLNHLMKLADAREAMREPRGSGVLVSPARLAPLTSNPEAAYVVFLFSLDGDVFVVFLFSLDGDACMVLFVLTGWCWSRCGRTFPQSAQPRDWCGRSSAPASVPSIQMPTHTRQSLSHSTQLHPTPPIVLMHIRACVALLDAVGRWF